MLVNLIFFFFFKQKTAYEMRISDWSSDVCSSDLRLIGVNNRDLRTFTTDLATTERLAPLAPEGALLVSESGINSHADCLRLAKIGVRAFLVGESLMRQANVEAATRALLNG